MGFYVETPENQIVYAFIVKALLKGRLTLSKIYVNMSCC